MWSVITIALATFVSTVAVAQSPAAQKAPETRDCQTAGVQSSAQADASKPCPRPASSAPQSAGERFPYPGETPGAETNKSDLHSTPDPQSPTPQTPGPAKQFPYPGDPSASGGSSSSSSSSSSSDNTSSSSRSSDPDPASGGNAADSSNPDEAAAADRHGSTRRKLPKVQRIQSNEDRESEDLSVAKYYRQSGNLQAAYLRSKDAVQMQPDDPEAHFALAEVAQTLKKKEEAVAEYSAYLRLEPEGERVNAANKALAALR